MSRNMDDNQMLDEGWEGVGVDGRNAMLESYHIFYS